MCGICGIIGSVGEENRRAIALMNAAMAHRGPDAEGTWESGPDARGHGLLLGHRRLAILDLSPLGAQPMVDRATGDVLSYNGELYNYRSLREQVERDGRTIRSTGDTEVLLAMLATRGGEALAGLRGMFAIAFWDTRQRRLLLARDPLGMKPLYVARNPDPSGRWSVVFASEVRTLLASGLLKSPRLDPRAVSSVVWNGFVAGTGTVVQGVESLAPGQLRVFGGDGAEQAPGFFWTAARRPEAEPVDEEELGRRLQETVRLHLASDVPLAVFLSGGVDSSAIANLATRSYPGQEVHTFTLAFHEKEFDEGAIARRVASAIGTHHQEVILAESDFVGRLEAAIESIDQPTFDGLNAYYLSRAVRDAGFIVALAGTGGDELFGGYTSFRDLPVLQRWARRTSLLPRAALGLAARIVSAAMQPRGRFPPQTRWAKLPDMIARGDDLLALYQLAYALFLPAYQRELLGPDVATALVDGLDPELRARLLAETSARTPLSAISVLDVRLFMGERLLRDNDAASMASSLEQRLPMVDHQLFESVDALPDDVRYQPLRKKALLRRLGLIGLDPALFDRPKSGFELPYDRWIRARLGDKVDLVLRDPEAVRESGLDPSAVAGLWRAFQEGQPGVHWSRVWAIYVLVRWCQRHGVKR